MHTSRMVAEGGRENGRSETSDIGFGQKVIDEEGSVQWPCGCFVRLEEAKGRIVPERTSAGEKTRIRGLGNLRDMEYGYHFGEMRGLMVGKEHGNDGRHVKFVDPSAGTLDS